MRELTIPSAGTASENSAARYVFANARSRPTHPALRVREDGVWRDVSSAQFAAEVSAVAAGLIASGINAGDRIALMSRTRYEWTLFDFAALAAGAVVVPIYETSSAAQVEWILKDSRSCAVLVETAAHRALVDTVRDRLPELRFLWQLDGPAPAAIAGLRTLGAAAGDAAFTARLDATVPSDVASVIYTSGTTGRPKGCVLTHANLIGEVAEVTFVLDNLFNPQNSTLLFLPLAHVFGRAIALGAIASGATLGHTGDLANLVEHLGEFKPTFILGVPRVFEKVHNGAKQRAHDQGRGAIFDRAERVAVKYSEALDSGGAGVGLRVQHLIFDRLVFAKLRAALGGRCTAAISGGAPLGTRLGHFFRGAGVTVYEGYGLTETTAGVCINRKGLIKIGSVGPPVSGMRVRTADDGELLLAGPVIFSHYWNNPEATAEALTEQHGVTWLRTGDIADIDQDGFVWITGRKKELIVTAAGKNVAPSVLEDRIRAHWLIDQCLVVGDRQPYVAALVTLDRQTWPRWVRSAGLDEASTIASQREDSRLLAEIQGVVTEANRAVSNAEAVKKFAVLADEWTEAGGQLTPSLKLKRTVVMAENAGNIAALYGSAGST